MEFGIHGVDKGSFYRLFDGIDVDFGTSNIARDTQMNWPDWMDQWEDCVKEAYNRYLVPSDLGGIERVRDSVGRCCVYLLSAHANAPTFPTFVELL
jgi:hypothetical protein